MVFNHANFCSALRPSTKVITPSTSLHGALSLVLNSSLLYHQTIEAIKKRMVRKLKVGVAGLGRMGARHALHFLESTFSYYLQQPSETACKVSLSLLQIQQTWSKTSKHYNIRACGIAAKHLNRNPSCRPSNSILPCRSGRRDHLVQPAPPTLRRQIVS